MFLEMESHARQREKISWNCILYLPSGSSIMPKGFHPKISSVREVLKYVLVYVLEKFYHTGTDLHQYFKWSEIFIEDWGTHSVLTSQRERIIQSAPLNAIMELFCNFGWSLQPFNLSDTLFQSLIFQAGVFASADS